MKKVLILLAWREPYKRIALMFECMQSRGHHIMFLSLPRGQWNISSFEVAGPRMEKGFLTLKERGVQFEGIPDVVICCHWSLLPIGVLLKALFGCKLMYDEYDYHELMLKTLGSRFQKHISSRLVTVFKGLTLWAYDLITCTHLKGDLHLKQLKTYSSHVLELNNFPSKSWAKKESELVGHTNIAFIYVGGIHERKGCKTAAEAFLSLNGASRQTEFHFFGRYGDKGLMDWLAAQPNMFVHTQVPPAKIRDFCGDKHCVGFILYENCDYYANVGTNSRKVYEYLAAGIPVIASRVGEIEALVRSDDVGYLVDGDVDTSTLTALLTKIVTDPKEIERKASNAAKLMSRNQMWWENEWEKVVDSGLLPIDECATS